MRAGVQFCPTVDGMHPVRLAVAAEERGFESIFFPDHTHVPVGSGNGADDYRRVMDPIAVLGGVAAATSRIRIGTAVCLVPQRDPIVLAKQVASLDQLAEGRLLLGVGAGSDAAELRNHGIDPATRFAVLRERIEAMTAIWTEDVASYNGKYVRFDPLWSWPKPVQRPRPPVLVGGVGPGVLARVVAYGDEWLPFRVGSEQVGGASEADDAGFADVLQRRMGELAGRAAAAGRPPIPVTVFNPAPCPGSISRYRDMGVGRVVFWLAPRDESQVLAALDELSELVANRA